MVANQHKSVSFAAILFIIATPLKKNTLILVILFTVLAIDQALKIWVKTNLCYGENFNILGITWARIHFVENPGMAFGFTFGDDYGVGKLILSLFRLCAFGFLVWYIRDLVHRKAPTGVLVSFTLILAGAIGNIIDSAFYGLIFSDSSYHCVTPATIFPIDGGYSSFLHGKVVDMLYFPMHEFVLPNWIPKIGGENFMFFAPVFNIADASITLGVISLIFFRSFFFDAPDVATTPTDNTETDQPTADNADTTDIETDK